MVPASFDESDEVLERPPELHADDCEALSVWRGSIETASGIKPVVISCWKLTQEEREVVLRTGRVWLLVFGHSMPPVFLQGTNPFHGDDPHEPVTSTSPADPKKPR